MLDQRGAVEPLAGPVDVDERAVLRQPVVDLDLNQTADDLLIEEAGERDDRRIDIASALDPLERRQILLRRRFQVNEQQAGQRIAKEERLGIGHAPFHGFQIEMPLLGESSRQQVF